MMARPLSPAIAAGALLALCNTLPAQPPGRGPGSELVREAIQLDLNGKGARASELLQKAIDTAATPMAKANAERAMAMSWAFDGNCRKTAEYENKVIAYWATREAEDPHNAFYQQGEMADEAARVCIDSGDLDSA